MAPFDVTHARSQFPSLKNGFIFADNAGGSQVAQGVIDRLTDYLINTNAQLGADYSISAESTRKVLVEGPAEAAKLFNAKSPNEIIFGSSSTLNLENLARGLESGIKAGDEFIVTGEHEANTGPWKKLAARSGAIVKYWKATPTKESNPYSVALKLEDVLPLITPRTRIVAFTACSNILGSWAIFMQRHFVKNAVTKAHSRDYWDWSIDADSSKPLAQSPLFDPVTGFGGDGVPGTYTLPPDPKNESAVPRPFAYKGCVQTGPFKDAVSHLGPGKLRTTHCLVRGIEETYRPALRSSNVRNTLSASNYKAFDAAVNSLMNGIHGSGHFIVGGEMTNVYSAGIDPLFYLHHANLDRIWWVWQQADRKNRLTDIWGPTTQNGPTQVTLDFDMDFPALGPNVK
ncbi:hypothetical protein EST38_g12026 [Candolleomyces aberdarensis]|uniref:Tyrosinase copper-binding domain-containing protein n=1 Tax=Candolleomyces aberdarensis TaxID=2316362 RepID=A0A4Q2D5Q3_9AGAR|nr:hypothetical protein EST38_g12026 [Candolleomyces aberdarensis]